MFIRSLNRRTGIEMWSDSRMVNVATDYCLCASCMTHGDGGDCPIHGKFVEITVKDLKVAAPILGCAQFVEKPNAPSLLDKYFDGDKLSAEKALNR